MATLYAVQIDQFTMRTSGARTPLGTLRSENSSPPVAKGDSESDATSKVLSRDKDDPPSHRNEAVTAPPPLSNITKSTPKALVPTSTPQVADKSSQVSKAVRKLPLAPSSVPIKLSRFAPPEQREAHRLSQATTTTGGKPSRRGSRSSRSTAKAAPNTTVTDESSGNLKPLTVADPVTARSARGGSRIPRTPSASSTTVRSTPPGGSGSRIPRLSLSPAALSSPPPISRTPDPDETHSYRSHDSPSPTAPGEGTEELVPLHEARGQLFSGTMYGNELFEAGPRQGLRCAVGEDPEPSPFPHQVAPLIPAVLRSLSEWLPASAPNGMSLTEVASDQDDAKMLSPAPQWADVSPQPAGTPEAQV